MKTKKAKVIMLPTEYIDIHPGNICNKKGDLYLCKDEEHAKYLANIIKTEDCNYLYITTDDEIKEGDWCIQETFGLGQITIKNDKECFVSKKRCINDGVVITPLINIKDTVKKIVATTDTDLNSRYFPKKHNVNKIPQQFIEEYCKAGGIDEVLLEMEEFIIQPYFGNKKQFNSLRLKIDSENCVIIHSIEPKLYTKDEVEELIYNATLIDNDEFHFYNWIKENLK